MEKPRVGEIGTYNIAEVNASDPMHCRVLSSLPSEVTRMIMTRKCLNCDQGFFGLKSMVYWYDKHSDSGQWWHNFKCAIRASELIHNIGETPVNRPVNSTE